MYILMNKDKVIGRFSIINGESGRSYHFEQKKDGILPVGFSDMGKWPARSMTILSVLVSQSCGF